MHAQGRLRRDGSDGCRSPRAPASPSPRAHRPASTTPTAGANDALCRGVETEPVLPRRRAGRGAGAARGGGQGRLRPLPGAGGVPRVRARRPTSPSASGAVPPRPSDARSAVAAGAAPSPPDARAPAPPPARGPPGGGSAGERPAGPHAHHVEAEEHGQQAGGHQGGRRRAGAGQRLLHHDRRSATVATTDDVTDRVAGRLGTTWGTKGDRGDGVGSARTVNRPRLWWQVAVAVGDVGTVAEDGDLVLARAACPAGSGWWPCSCRGCWTPPTPAPPAGLNRPMPRTWLAAKPPR